MMRSSCIVMAVVVLMVLRTSSAQEMTTSCPMVRCAPDCAPDTGSDGCPTCACPPTCQDTTCANDEECVLQEVNCFRAPCFPQPTCIPRQQTTVGCRMFKCAPDCVPDTGPDGCPTCACPRTCEDITCANDEECVLQEVNCFVAPCFRQPTCIPRQQSCAETPNTKRCGRTKIPWLRFWFYNSSANACQRFRYYGCTPSPNTFLSRRACEDKCKRRDPPICPAIACARGCYSLKRRNQCRRCICPNQCKNFPCSAGEECQLREVKCAEEQCPTEPFCASKSCPEQPPCGIRCMNGLKTDENGCQLCECV